MSDMRSVNSRWLVAGSKLKQQDDRHRHGVGRVQKEAGNDSLPPFCHQLQVHTVMRHALRFPDPSRSVRDIGGPGPPFPDATRSLVPPVP